MMRSRQTAFRGVHSETEHWAERDMAKCYLLLLVFETLALGFSKGVVTGGNEHSNATAYNVTHISFELVTMLAMDVDTTSPPEENYYDEETLSNELTEAFKSDTSVYKIEVIGIRREVPIVDFYMWSSTVLKHADVENILNEYYIYSNSPVKEDSLNVDDPCDTSCDVIDCLKDSDDECVANMVNGVSALYPHLYPTDGETTPVYVMTTATPNVERTKDDIGSSGQKDDQKVTSTSSGDADMTDMPTNNPMTDENLATSSNCGENCGMDGDDTQSHGTVTVAGDDDGNDGNDEPYNGGNADGGDDNGEHMPTGAGTWTGEGTGGSNTNGDGQQQDDTNDEDDDNGNTGGCIDGEGDGCQGEGDDYGNGGGTDEPEVGGENRGNGDNSDTTAENATEPDDSTAFPYKIVVPVLVALFFLIIIIIIIIVIQNTKQPVIVAPEQ